MGITTFTNTVKVGDKANTALSRSEALGQVAVAQSALLSYTDASSAIDVCTLPANSQIIDIYVDVLTAFNSSGTDLLDIGKSGDADHFANDLDLSSAARLLGSSDVSQLANYDDIGTSQVTVQATYTQSVADASAGSARITVLYIPNNNLA